MVLQFNPEIIWAKKVNVGTGGCQGSRPIFAQQVTGYRSLRAAGQSNKAMGVADERLWWQSCLAFGRIVLGQGNQLTKIGRSGEKVSQPGGISMQKQFLVYRSKMLLVDLECGKEKLWKRCR